MLTIQKYKIIKSKKYIQFLLHLNLLILFLKKKQKACTRFYTTNKCSYRIMTLFCDMKEEN